MLKNASQTMLLPHTYAYIVPYFAIHPPMSGYSRAFFTHIYDHSSVLGEGAADRYVQESENGPAARRACRTPVGIQTISRFRRV